MSENLDFKLVKGFFSPEGAKTVVNSLINSKINFHNLEDFSNSIRFNTNVAYSKTRIKELNEIKSKLNEIIAAAAHDGKEIELKCHFEINVLQ